MAEIALPFEVKRLIYDHVDLATMKSLRLVSQSWAAVGIELLFLPTFTIKSSSIDISRLIKIGSRPEAARQAAKTIRTLCFWSNDWDAVCLRSIVCSRHVHLSNWEIVDFVPDQNESEALDELDVLIEQRKCDESHGEGVALLTQAMKQVPALQKLHITRPNPFKHPILRKVWEEYDFETYRHPSYSAGPIRLLNIFTAAKNAGLEIRQFHHNQFNTNYFYDVSSTGLVPWDFSHHFNTLQSLSIAINDLQGKLSGLRIGSYWGYPIEEADAPLPHNQAIIALPQTLQTFSLEYESIERVPTLFLERPTVTPALPLTLHTLSLGGLILSPTPFLTLLSTQAPSLTQLNLNSIEIQPSGLNPPSYDWKAFLTDLRSTTLGSTRLRKFQLAGVVKSPLPNGPIWMFWPIYRTSGDEWEDMPPPVKPARNPNARERTREVERFVIGGGEWPIKEEDDVSRFVS